MENSSTPTVDKSTVNGTVLEDGNDKTCNDLDDKISSKIVEVNDYPSDSLPIETSNTKGGKGEATLLSTNWSEILKSPVGVLGFSPSQQIGSHHGLGKQII